jgi:hypothetical protein
MIADVENALQRVPAIMEVAKAKSENFSKRTM